MDKIFHAYISYNSDRVSGSGYYDIGYFHSRINAQARIIGEVENSIIDGFVKNYRKGNEIIENKELYSFNVGDLITELTTGEVDYVNINGIDYYFHAKPIKIED